MEHGSRIETDLFPLTESQLPAPDYSVPDYSVEVGQAGPIIRQRLPTQEEALPLPINDQFADLVNHVAATGDPEALWQLAAGFRPELVTLTTNMTKRYQGWLRVEPDDIVSDAIVKVFNRFKNISSSEGPKQYPQPWIQYFVRSVKWVIADHCKSIFMQKTVPRGGLVVSDSEDNISDLVVFGEFSQSAEDDYMVQERQLRVIEALGTILERLNPHQRKVAQDYFEASLDGRVSLDEIGQRNGLRSDAVKALMWRVRQKVANMRANGVVALPDDAEF